MTASEAVDLLRQYRTGFESIPLHEFLGLRLRRIRGPVVVELDLAEDVRGLGHRLHGGAVATLIDVASCIAAVRGSMSRDGHELRTAEVTVKYRSAPSSGPIIAEATVGDASGETVEVACLVRDGLGHLVAEGQFVAGFVSSGGDQPEDHSTSSP